MKIKIKIKEIKKKKENMDDVLKEIKNGGHKLNKVK